MQNRYSQFEKRKQDHIELALMPCNQTDEMNDLDTIHLVHEALPDLDFADISLRGVRFGEPVNTPFLVSSMTAGHQDAARINRCLIAACADKGWAMGVGSQRRELMDDEAAFEWLPLRRDYPQVTLMSNIGIAQLIDTPVKRIQQLTEALEARALIVHCNPLQEVIQPEGTPQFKGCWQAIERVVAALTIPVVIKETGCGFSASTLSRLNNLGIAAVDVSGLGGTHWGRIEGHRAAASPKRQQAAKTFANWGITTVASVRQAAALNPQYELWGSGGVRHGLDAARLIALGASTVGFAKPMLEVALKGFEQVVERMTTIEYELKVAMFCTGSLHLSDLKGKACP
ncbi:type 2 isopentenyl-diphosphate Delta-isomerase [Legionella taurinensis]|uniref:Isopentenyl-diphosphate delta-isomerase n=1 Tax=Legionella taurinensis TaxID=70611 RepID=A0A3A5L3G2_9GAMM|nr:type 2 isopentenyl-diphosphate Delta-isomerase [Legionella taurinensis]MDX1838639.1 type 2 isopentenyl-diphosphate Delta-isomerase [Legionella taurinensis]PUT38852.1 type 2 isopentenyl-diphosphate Delta-isomerase [Legionella taurinensis]PUT40150.1 type 2 isopentenyl-diphosphate Delta-isomerase [Legionella taurinensis]PUT42456.1 type 2 isopentenyl-diphosphate Delta-isomerase [Legionella taurinensis]PUT44637.1 type 2 isopentenyl-diphosphate Delta-isomerase [Legionella taurinensis]